MPNDPPKSKVFNARLEVPASRASSRKTSPHGAGRSAQPSVIGEQLLTLLRQCELICGQVEAQATVEGAVGTSQSISNNKDWRVVPNTVALVDRLPPLIHALETLAHVHPFVQVAVGAFRVIAEFELKRLGNDKRVGTLILEMQNMMSALLQLRPVRANHVGHDGVSIGERLADLVKRTAEDINECAKTCDSYASQRLLAKVFNASSWDVTFKEYTQRFSSRKAEFTFAISIHTGIGVDRVNEKLDALADKSG
ncbi:hypothetical protein GY45DRAFT_1245740 [Cubamyces sp. BRFM 1775]|nr:hypothetical protein GY45DRAFT_1245740 [Cubamyces sp. BRFM 1775]